MVVEDPVLLYLKPHHSHKAMGEAIDAEFIEYDDGGPLSRIRTARQLDVGNRPVISEGGAPLFQAAWMRKFGNCGPVIHLAADETLMNIVRKLPHYQQRERLAHWWSHRHVDGVLAISPQLTAEARAIGVDNIRTIHPFPTPEKWEKLGDIEPGYGTNQVLVVGSKGSKNGFDILQAVADAADRELQIEVVGPQTEEISSENVTGHGFVPLEKFYEFYRQSGAFLLPARSQAFALSPVEAMRAGLPPVVTVETGCQAYLGKAAPELVTGRSPEMLAESVEWALDNPEVSEKLRQVAKLFNPEDGIHLFKTAYKQLLKQAEGDIE